MSQTEFHTGKLYPVKHEKSLEETCRAIAARHNIVLGEDWQEDFRDAFDEYKSKFGSVQNEEYFIYGENLYRVVDHVESEDSEYFMNVTRNDDGSLQFIGQFYNGGTCFAEMLEEALDNLKPMYIEQIKIEVDKIIEEHGEDMPKTVPSAATLIMKYHGIVKARDLFAGAARETEGNPFKNSAYVATLQTTLK